MALKYVYINLVKNINFATYVCVLMCPLVTSPYSHNVIVFAHMHTNIADKSNFKNPGVSMCVPGCD